MRGFTLIEVMVAVLVLALGLLGFALLQTMNVRFTQSANYRTQATNLAYEVLDQIRVNRLSGHEYVGDYGPADEDCVGALVSDGVEPQKFMEAWSCRLNGALGSDARASISLEGNRYSVDIRWNDERWTDGGSEPDFSVEAEI